MISFFRYSNFDFGGFEASSERQARGLKHVSEKRDVDVSGFRPSKHLGFNRHPLSSVTFNEFEVVYNMVITLIVETSDC